MAPDTKARLQDQMAPLMQWLNISGESEARRLDLQFLKLQLTKLLQPSKVSIEALPILEKVTNLSMHLNEVRSQAEIIKQVQQPDFFEQSDHQILESTRLALRKVIHFHH